jgi:hypothetical protein
MEMNRNINGVAAVFGNAETDGSVITIPKSDIESCIAQFERLGAEKMHHGCPTWESWFYWGKREVLTDLLGMLKSNEENVINEVKK